MPASYIMLLYSLFGFKNKYFNNKRLYDLPMGLDSNSDSKLFSEGTFVTCCVDCLSYL